MTDEDKQAEDVAAVLMGFRPCYYCGDWLRKEDCPLCKGRRWIKTVVGDCYMDKNRDVWVYDGTEYRRAGFQ